MGVLHGFVDGHGRLLDELDPVQPFHVHVAFVAGHEEAHRIALGRVDALAVLIERNHRVIERLGEGDAPIHARPVGAFGKEPLRLRVDAGFLEQRGEPHAGPLGARHQAVDRLHVGLNRVFVVERRAVAAAFDEIDARHLRIARQRIKIENQRLLHQAMDRQAVLGRVDIGEAGPGDHEMQAGRRNGSVQEMMRRARLAGPRLTVRIGQGADHLAFVLRRNPIGRNCGAGRQAPGIDRQRFGAGGGQRSADAGTGGASQEQSAPEQGAAIEQAVAGGIRRR